MLRSLLEHPLARGLDLDDPETTVLRRQIIANKPFLQDVYRDWYKMLARAVSSSGTVLEIGAGAGFSKQHFARLYSSDIQVIAGIDLVADACRLPFASGTLDGIIMTNVFHHLPDVRGFLDDAARSLKPQATLAMVEPWVTPWSRFVYGRIHHEPFDPRANEWKLAAGAPLSVANGALPWIVFRRDVARFRATYPRLQVVSIRPFMPIRYLLSGGVSLRSFMPAWSSPVWRAVERALAPIAQSTAMFALIVIRRVAESREL